MRSIEQIDRDIDAIRRTLMTRLHANPDMSSRAWQNAWDRCPTLRRRETELFLERADAVDESNRLAYIEQQRKERAARRAANKHSQLKLRRCPACGGYSRDLAA